MNPGVPDLFGRPLAPDPRIALPSLPARPVPDVPCPRAQFCVELVGQFPQPGSLFSPLLNQPLFSQLGQPQVYVLRPEADDWERFIPNATQMYDSAMLCWDYLAEHGQLSGASAGHLLQVADSFAVQLTRRALSLTDVAEVDEIASSLREVEQQLDTGLSVGAAGSSPVLERDIWIVCSNLGLSFSPTGSFDWVVPEHPEPALSVTPIGDVEQFSLGNVQQGLSHTGISASYRLARCPAAEIAAEACYRVVDVFAKTFRGLVFDESGNSLTPAIRLELKQTLDTVIGMLNRAGLPPGSPAALKVFR